MLGSSTPTSTSTESTPPVKSGLYYVLFLVLVPLFGLLTFYGLLAYYRANPNLTPPFVLQNYLVESEAVSDTQPQPTLAIPSPKPSPSPIPLTPGPGIYQVSQGKHSGPSVWQVTFDPLDVKQGETLNLSAIVRPDQPADVVTATLQMDNSTIDITFQKSSSTESGELWTAELNLPDSVLYKYILIITSHNAEGSSSFTVAPRS